jgi:hypothetical protein
MNVWTYSPWLCDQKTDTGNRFTVAGRATTTAEVTPSATAVPAWTLESGGVEKSAEEWGVSGMQRREVSQGVSTLSFVEVGDFTASPLFAYGASVIVRRERTKVNGVYAGGSIYWQGVVTKVPRVGTASEESKRYVLSDPWWYLERRIMKGRWNVGALISPEFAYSSHIILGLTDQLDGNNQPVNATISQQMIAVLDWCIMNGDPIQYSTGTFPTAVMFSDEVRERTCGECIKKCLRLAPDAVTWWDHTTTPPTFHCAKRADLAAATFTLGTKPLASVEITRMDENVVPCVQMIYERTNETDGVAQLEVIHDTYPVGKTGNESGAFIETIDLKGYQLNYVRAELVCDTIDPTSLAWWKQHAPKLDHANVTEFSIDNSTISINGLNTAQSASFLATYPRKLVHGQLAPWMVMTVGLSRVPVIGSRSQIRAKLHIKYVDETGKQNETYEPMSVDIVATNATTGPYFSVESFTAADPVPSGLSQALYEAMNQVHYSGQVTLIEQEVNTALRAAGITDRTGVGMVLNIASGEAGWATMRALVQQCTEDIDSGTTILSVGPSEFLGAKDLIEHSRIGRFRFVYTNPLARLAGINALNGQVQLGKQTANDNTVDGLADFRKWSMSAPDKGSITLDVDHFQSVNSPAVPRHLEVRQIKYCQGGKEYHFLVPCSKLIDPDDGSEVDFILD